MRWRGRALLLLVAVFVVPAAAEGSADTIPAKINGDNSSAHSGVRKLIQPDETNHNKDHVVPEEKILKNDTNENIKKDNPTEGTKNIRDEPTLKPKDKNNNASKSSQVGDFLQDPLVKDCDPSHSCVIAKKEFVACLKVPGEGSLALSLLMDNKGLNPLYVSITAPDYVSFAQSIVHVEAISHNETQVKFSSSDAANDTAIVLKVAEESCTINIHSAITRETVRAIRVSLTSRYTLVPAFLLLAVAGVCIKLRRVRKQDGGPAVYQKLDTAELPVSIGGKKESNQSDNWDDNWGDDWDDEEAQAPLTPSKPTMHNQSSKGLAPRRSTKDGWKD